MEGSLCPWEESSTELLVCTQPCCSLLGGSTGALLALILPGLVAVRQDGMAHTCGGAMLVVLGAALAIAAILRLAFFAA